MTFKNKKIPDLYLEQLSLDELDESKKDEILNELKQAPILNKRIQNIPLLNQQFHTESRHSLDLDEINQRVINHNKNKTRSANVLWQYASIPLVFIVAIFLTSPNNEINEISHFIDEENQTIRLKGIKPELHIYRKNRRSAELISTEQEIKENDILQIRYQGAGYQYAVIFSIDGGGTLTLHHPNEEKESGKIIPQGDIALPFAYKLDDAPKFERFFLVASHKKMNIRDIIKQGEIIAKNKISSNEETLNLPDEIFQTSILLTKAKK